MEYGKKNRRKKYWIQMVCEACNKLYGCCENRMGGEIKHCSYCAHTKSCELVGEPNMTCYECWIGEENKDGTLKVNTDFD